MENNNKLGTYLNIFPFQIYMIPFIFLSRLLVLFLLENAGVLQMAREFGDSRQSEDFTNERFKPVISRLAQTVTSIPDKARFRAPPSLSS